MEWGSQALRVIVLWIDRRSVASAAQSRRFRNSQRQGHEPPPVEREDERLLVLANQRKPVFCDDVIEAAEISGHAPQIVQPAPCHQNHSKTMEPKLGNRRDVVLCVRDGYRARPFDSVKPKCQGFSPAANGKFRSATAGKGTCLNECGGARLAWWLLGLSASSFQCFAEKMP